MFQEALAAGPGSPERDRYIFRPGRGEAGELPPNDWQSSFGGPAWERVADGEWYLHLLCQGAARPQLKNPEVHEEFKKDAPVLVRPRVDGSAWMWRMPLSRILRAVRSTSSRPMR